LASDPADDTGWLALADCLEEAGQPARAELVRLQTWLRRRLDDPQWPAWEERLRDLWADGVEGCQPTVVGPAGVEFVLIRPGEFWMGARDGEQWCDGNESPRHRVTLTRGFWLARTPVTLGQIRFLIGIDPDNHDPEPATEEDHNTAKHVCENCSF